MRKGPPDLGKKLLHLGTGVLSPRTNAQPPQDSKPQPVGGLADCGAPAPLGIGTLVAFLCFAQPIPHCDGGPNLHNSMPLRSQTWSSRQERDVDWAGCCLPSCFVPPPLTPSQPALPIRLPLAGVCILVPVAWKFGFRSPQLHAVPFAICSFWWCVYFVRYQLSDISSARAQVAPAPAVLCARPPTVYRSAICGLPKPVPMNQFNKCSDCEVHLRYSKLKLHHSSSAAGQSSPMNNRAHTNGCQQTDEHNAKSECESPRQLAIKQDRACSPPIGAFLQGQAHRIAHTHTHTHTHTHCWPSIGVGSPPIGTMSGVPP